MANNDNTVKFTYIDSSGSGSIIFDNLDSYVNHVIVDGNSTGEGTYAYLFKQKFYGADVVDTKIEGAISQAQVKSDWNETDTTSTAYILNKNIVTDELTYLHNAYDNFISYYEEDAYVIATALTDLDTRINDIDIPTLVRSDWNTSDTSSYAYILNKPTIPDITNKADKSAAIGSLTLELNQLTYVITLSGTKVDGTSFTVSDQIDLPLESVVVGGNYNDTTKKVELSLKSGSTVEFSVADLVAGLQSEITSANKLSGDLIEDGTNNKVINVKSDWNESDTASYAYILNKPSIPTLVQSDWDESDSTSYAYILNKPTIPTLVNADWNETNSTYIAYIQNKPNITQNAEQLSISYGGSNIILYKDSGNLALTSNNNLNFDANGSELSFSSNGSVFLEAGSNNLIISQYDNHLLFNDENIAFQSEAFDGSIVLSTNDESDIDSIENGIYRLQYIDIIYEEGEPVGEELTNSAILIQKTSDNQYMYINGIVKHRVYTENDGWSEWEQIGGVQSDWNESDSSSPAYILNKPEQTQADWLETSTSSPAYIQNTYIVTDELTYLHNAYDSFISYYEEDAYVIATALTDLDTRITDVSTSMPTLVKSDWNETNTASYAYILNKPTIPTLVQSDWNESDNTSYAYILNKPNGEYYVNSINNIINSVGDEFIIGTNDEDQAAIKFGWDAPGYFISLTIDEWNKSIILDETDGIYINDDVNDHLQYNNEDIAFLSEITQSDWNISDDTSLAYIKNKPTIPTLVNANWNESDTTSAAYIQNKPDLSQYITIETPLTLGNTTGVGNAVTNISVSGHQITMTKGSTFLTEHQTLKTINNETIVGSGNLVVSGLPQVSSTDNGKILMVVNGQWQLVSPSVLYSGSGIPNNANGNNGDLYMQTS